MPYQYVREPLTADESDRLSHACETTTERLVVWTLLDTGLRVGELCGITPRSILWQQRQLRVKGKAGAHGKRAKVRVLPMSPRVRTLLEHHFALEKAFPVKTRRARGHRQGGGQPGGDHQGREPARLAAHVRHDGLTEGDQPADGAEDPRPRPARDDGDLPQLHERRHPGRVRAEVVTIGRALSLSSKLDGLALFCSVATRSPEKAARIARPVRS